MTFEERIREYCLRSDIVYERILSLSCEKDLYILYPSKLANEQILKDNIPKMLKVIKEYISELELCAYCMLNEAHKHQDNADGLAEIMNDGISPYAWYYYDTVEGYVVCLDNI